jgi:hypothetical protein
MTSASFGLSSGTMWPAANTFMSYVCTVSPDSARSNPVNPVNTYRHIARSLIRPSDFAVDLPCCELRFIEALLASPLESFHPHLVPDMIA